MTFSTGQVLLETGEELLANTHVVLAIKQFMLKGPWFWTVLASWCV